MSVDLASVRAIVEQLLERETGDSPPQEDAFPQSEEFEAVEDKRAHEDEVPDLEKLKALLMVSTDDAAAVAIADSGFSDLYLLVALSKSKSVRYRELATQVLGNVALSCPISVPDTATDLAAAVCTHMQSPDPPLAAAAANVALALVSAQHSDPASSAVCCLLDESPLLLQHVFGTLVLHPISRTAALKLMYAYVFTTLTMAALLSAAPMGAWCQVLQGVFHEANAKGCPDIGTMQNVAAVLDLLKQLEGPERSEVALLADECSKVVLEHTET